jgi:hypothetical protein
VVAAPSCRCPMRCHAAVCTCRQSGRPQRSSCCSHTVPKSTPPQSLVARPVCYSLTL